MALTHCGCPGMKRYGTTYVWSSGPEARSETDVSMTVLVMHEVQSKAELSSCEVKGLVVLLGLVYLS